MCAMEKNISKEIWMLIVHHNSSTELLKEKDILQSESMIVACFLLSSLPPAGVLLNCNVNNFQLFYQVSGETLLQVRTICDLSLGLS